MCFIFNSITLYVLIYGIHMHPIITGLLPYLLLFSLSLSFFGIAI